MYGQLRAVAFGTFMACFVVCISAPFLIGPSSLPMTGWCAGVGAVLLVVLILTRGRD
jgi:hypothetical protein